MFPEFEKYSLYSKSKGTITSSNTIVMKEQTAVEWLIMQLKEYDFADIKDSENYIIKIPAWVLTEKEEQAKKMEKEQTKAAYEIAIANYGMPPLETKNK